MKTGRFHVAGRGSFFPSQDVGLEMENFPAKDQVFAEKSAFHGAELERMKARGVIQIG